MSSMKKATADPSGLLLLDVNLLLAMARPNHQFHLADIQRLESSRNGRATCALTQPGFIESCPNARRPAEAAREISTAARFVTFDARIKHLTAPGATLEVLGLPA
jgi:hypothetical protein